MTLRNPSLRRPVVVMWGGTALVVISAVIRLCQRNLTWIGLALPIAFVIMSSVVTWLMHQLDRAYIPGSPRPRHRP